LNENKASLNIPNKLIKLASSQLAIPFSYIYIINQLDWVLFLICLKYLELPLSTNRVS
jgi:hypothetical protein